MSRFEARLRLQLWAAALIALGAIDTSRLGSSWVVAAGLSAFSLACVLELVLIGPNKSQIAAPPLRWFVLWLAWAAGSGIFAPAGPQTLWWVGLFAVMAAAAVAIYSASGELGLAQTLLGGFVLFVLLSLGSRLIDPAVDLTSAGDRLSLLALEANQAVRMAAVAALASAYLLISGVRVRSAVRTAVGALGGVGALAVVVAGQSRTGTAALLLSLAVFAVALAPKQKQRLMVAVGLAVMVAGVGIGLFASGGVSSLVGDFEAVASREQDSSEDQSREIQSLNGRLEIWPEIISEASLQPISGYGLGSDRDVVTQLYADGRIGWLAQHTHNFFLQVLLTTGYVGLALMLIALSSTAVRAFTGAKNPLGPALLVLVLVDGISEAAIRVPSFGWFALVAAAAVAAGTVSPATDS